MSITAQQWRQLSELLDVALDMSEAERTTWLEGMLRNEPVATLLRELLAQRAQFETGDFLSTPPNIAAAFLADVARSPTLVGELQVGAEVGAYRLLRELGHGGMASVWLAERIDGKLKRQVALKFPYAGPNRRSLTERLLRERDILASLEHPNIARLYDADVTPSGQPFLVLEYVDGVPINEYCDRHKLTVRQRLKLFEQVFEAVQYAHARLVIHRDIKPDNILITDSGVVRLLDFGIAKVISAEEAEDSALTLFGGRALTPDYASPEQLKGEMLTTSSDIYTLSVVLYELLTGKRPYRLKRESSALLEEAIAEGHVVAPSESLVSEEVAAARATSPRQLARELRGDIDTILLQALRSDPKLRYPSVDAFHQDIGRHLRSEAVAARRDSAWYRLRKLVARHRVMFASGAAVTLAIVAGAGIAWYQARVAVAQAQRLRAVQTFLMDVFNANSRSQPDPLKAQQATARELLDRAADRLERQPAGVAETDDELLHSLGNLYSGLGMDARAAEMAGRRAQLAQQAYGGRDKRTLSAQLDYGRALYATEKWKDALPVFTQIEQALEARNDRTSELAADLYFSLAEYWRASDQEKSRAYAGRAVALFRERYPDDPDFIEALRSAAVTETHAGRTPEAQQLFAEALAVARRLGLGEEALVRPLVEFAETQATQLQFAGAEQNFATALEISRRVNGDEHIDTIQTQLRYAGFLRNAARLRESQALLSAAERTATALLGDNESFHVPTVRLELARTEHALGHWETADALFKRAIEVREATRANTYQHANMLVQYSRLLLDFGLNDESRRMAERAGSINASIGYPNGASDVPLSLAVNFLISGDGKNALRVLDSATDGAERRNLWTQIRCEMYRARAMALLGRVEESERLLRAQLDRLRTAPPQRLLESELDTTLARLLIADSRAPEAIDYLRTALKWRSELLVPESPLVADTQVALAEGLIAAGQRNEARGLLAKASDIYSTHPRLGRQYQASLRSAQKQLLAVD
jgi:serine/threonine-protein kinase